MSNSSVSNLPGDEVNHQPVGQPPPLLQPQSSSQASGSLSHHHQQKSQPVDPLYKNVPLGKPSSSSSLYQPGNQQQQPHQQPPSHQGNQTNHPNGTVYAQRADVWSSVTSSVTTPPPPTPDDELLSQLSLEELISRIRSLETKNRKLLYDNGSMTKDINHHLSTLQQLKQQNYHLLAENNELRELACFLEDEKTRSRSIAREWQSFGTHMSRVMRHEFTNYSNKLAQLESKQFELVRENFELKQLCLLLDNALTTRDGPEGSLVTSLEQINPSLIAANLTNSNGLPSNNLPFTLRPKSTSKSNSTYANTESNLQSQQRVVLSQQILEYIRSLEDRIKQLEVEKVCNIEVPRSRTCNDVYENASALNHGNSSNDNQRQPPTLPTCPQPLLMAMQALKVQEDPGSHEGAKNLTSNTNNNTSKTMEANRTNLCSNSDQ